MQTIRYLIKEKSLTKLCFQNVGKHNHEQFIDDDYVSNYLKTNLNFDGLAPYLIQTKVCGVELATRTFDYKWQKTIGLKQAVVWSKYLLPKKSIHKEDICANRTMEEYAYFSMVPLLVLSEFGIEHYIGHGSLLMFVPLNIDIAGVADEIKSRFEKLRHEISFDGSFYDCELYKQLVEEYRGLIILHYSINGGGSIRKKTKGEVEFLPTFPINSLDIYVGESLI
jgi:hypothetical protein